MALQFEYDPERLIEEVKKRRGIWDYDNADHRAKNVRHQLWKEIVKELLQPDVMVSKSEMRELEIQLQKKWKSIRDCFQKYVQNPNKTRRPYIYFKQLQFLLKSDSAPLPVAPVSEVVSSDSDDQTKKSKKWRFKRKLKLAKDDESTEDDNDNDNFDNNDESRDFSNDGVVEYEIPVKVSKMSKPTNEFAFANVDVQPKNDNDDPDRLFLLSLLPHLKAIPEESRLNAKMDLMHVLRNASLAVNGDQKIF